MVKIIIWLLIITFIIYNYVKHQPQFYIYWKLFKYKRPKYKPMPVRDVLIAVSGIYPKIDFNINQHVGSMWGLFKSCHGLHHLPFFKDVHIGYHQMIEMFLGAARFDSRGIDKNIKQVRKTIKTLLKFRYWNSNMKNQPLRQFAVCVLLAIRIQDQKLYDKAMRRFLWTQSYCISEQGWFLEGWAYAKYSDCMFDIFFVLDLVDHDFIGYQRLRKMIILIAHYSYLNIKTDFYTFSYIKHIKESYYWTHIIRTFDPSLIQNNQICEVFKLSPKGLLGGYTLMWNFKRGFILDYWRMTHSKVRKHLKKRIKYEYYNVNKILEEKQK